MFVNPTFGEWGKIILEFSKIGFCDIIVGMVRATNFVA